MKKVTVGMIGGGYAAYLHGNGYKRVSGINVRLKTVVDISEKAAKQVAEEFGFEGIHNDYRAVLEDDEIDVIDIVTPPVLHTKIVIDALKAGKHVICEKPFTGYFGRPGDPELIGKEVSKAEMYKIVMEEMDEARKIIDSSDKLFMYAENYVYCPNVLKAAELIRKKKSKILFMKGEESLRGSSSPVAGYWRKIGGGSLMRIGCHPLSGILWLKQEEAKARGETITVKSIVADTGMITSNLTENEKKYITIRPVDVEDIATVSITFSDGTKALVIAADTCLGGTKNYIEIYNNDSTLICNITPADNMSTYFLDEEGIEDVRIAEMLPTKIGWQKAFVPEEILRGYTGELQDFVECVAYNRKPLSGFELSYETTKVMYAAYVSASEGRIFIF